MRIGEALWPPAPEKEEESRQTSLGLPWPWCRGLLSHGNSEHLGMLSARTVGNSGSLQGVRVGQEMPLEKGKFARQQGMGSGEATGHTGRAQVSTWSLGRGFEPDEETSLVHSTDVY